MTETVCVTGATGFIAKHVVRSFLDAGFGVRATLRSDSRADEVRAAVLPGLAPDAAGRLTFATLDLTRDDGWDSAMAGMAALIHTASPFPIAQPQNEDDLIRPAVEGTLRALGAAHRAGVGRVVLTSSTVAALGNRSRAVIDESDWLDPSAPGTTAYARSKVLAERAAWDFVTAKAPGMALTTINPGLVAGPPLDAHFGSSVGLIQRILSARDPMQPAFGLPIVDVRDVALMHLRAVQRPGTAGRRYLAVAGSMWMADMAKALKAAYPDRRIRTAIAPTVLLRVMALFDAEVRAILPMLGHLDQVSNARATADMGMAFIPAADAIRATAAFLVDHKLV